ncbi:hypothetical protein F9K97_20445 [Brucella anthropi]|uniref:Uncharacterized protein n=2 Tax=Brucella TaxID=234 RepID=A0A6I0D4P9_BRUAN|nr:hypothetical protein F9L03_19645 [Brucella lupini]KAB2727906.1 hypothetical protein F9K76_00120 [Brucella anthropi]MCR5940469.1 hypothetical protein [Ochrobactrum sp. XJ1]RNL44661.1 hypothetical protein D7I41_12910 [Ochrobactrum sp. MH181795]KAB2730916.1 hypothetical protein F9K90_20550 [Brucella anthropi]
MLHAIPLILAHRFSNKRILPGRIKVGCGKKICDSVCGGNFEYLDRMRAFRMQPRVQFIA